jgi:hypothetical protein
MVKLLSVIIVGLGGAFDIAAQKRCDLVVYFMYPLSHTTGAFSFPEMPRAIAINRNSKRRFEAETTEKGDIIFHALPVGRYSMSLRGEELEVGMVTGTISNFRHQCTTDPEYVQLERTRRSPRLKVVARQEILEVRANEVDLPPLPSPTPTPEPAATPVPMGILNERAVSVPAAVYPPELKDDERHTVAVRVIVDENGSVIYAKGVLGDKWLWPAAEAAAMKAKFNPTLVAGRPVQITGGLFTALHHDWVGQFL